jgi:hypothetical protein
MLAAFRQNAWSDVDHRREFEWKAMSGTMGGFRYLCRNLRLLAEIKIKTNSRKAE